MDMKYYGPYTRKDGRKHMVIVREDGTKTSISYPKYLMEQHLGRQLVGDETVDHIDDDFTNDTLDNLQILSQLENIAKYHKSHPAKMFEFDCPQCGSHAIKPMNDVKANRKKGSPGPFCSRSCAGKWRHAPVV